MCVMNSVMKVVLSILLSQMSDRHESLPKAWAYIGVDMCNVWVEWDHWCKSMISFTRDNFARNANAKLLSNVCNKKCHEGGIAITLMPNVGSPWHFAEWAVVCTSSLGMDVSGIVLGIACMDSCEYKKKSKQCALWTVSWRWYYQCFNLKCRIAMKLSLKHEHT